MRPPASPGLRAPSFACSTRALIDVLGIMVRVHGPRVTVVQQRTRSGRIRADLADIGPEVTPEGASASSDRSREGLLDSNAVGPSIEQAMAAKLARR